MDTGLNGMMVGLISYSALFAAIKKKVDLITVPIVARRWMKVNRVK